MKEKYEAFFKKIGTETISEKAQCIILEKPQSWNRYLELAILNAINNGELPPSEARFYRAYFEGSHERISYKSLEKVVQEMEQAGVCLIEQENELIVYSNQMDKVTLLGWLADLFPKYG